MAAKNSASTAGKSLEVPFQFTMKQNVTGVCTLPPDDAMFFKKWIS